MPEIQIIKPMVFEIAFSVLPPGIPTISTPPGFGLQMPISLKFQCPLATYCGTDLPCGWSGTLPLALTLPIPKFSFPPQFNLPKFGFRFEVPPPIFVSCPAFPEKDWQENYDKMNQNNKQPETRRESGNTTTMNITPQEFSKFFG